MKNMNKSKVENKNIMQYIQYHNFYIAICYLVVYQQIYN
jgi:hypothetical protein